MFADVGNEFEGGLSKSFSLVGRKPEHQLNFGTVPLPLNVCYCCTRFHDAAFD